jgi:hypothetical protein
LPASYDPASLENTPWTIEGQAFAFEKYLNSASGRAFAKKRL